MRRLMQAQRGQAMVETAIAMLVIVPMIIWLLEMTSYFYTVAVFQYASRQGVQYAMTHGSDAAGTTQGCVGPASGCDATGAAVKSLVANLSGSSGHKLTTSNVTATWGATGSPGDTVTVTVNYTYKSIFPIKWTPSTIQGQASGNLVY